MKKNVLLLTAPTDSNYFAGGANDGPVLGLVALQNYVYRGLQDPPSIKIMDGERCSLETILSAIETGGFDVVGIQPMQATYRNCLEIAEVARRASALVVFGGHHATQLSREIALNRRTIVDYVVVGDGEAAFMGLILEKEPASLPNLVYWDDSKQDLATTCRKDVPLDEGRIDHFDTALLDQYRDKANFERGEQECFRAYSHKGCSNRMRSEYCFFCGRADKGVRWKSPQVYLEELRFLSEVHKADLIWEIGDDFLQDHRWLSDLLELKTTLHGMMGPPMKIYARANKVVPQVIDLLKRLNVAEVAIGFESGSPDILKNINKNLDPEKNMEAAKLLLSNGINVAASFVLGLPGENDRTLAETFKLASDITEMSYKYLGRPAQQTLANLIEINPGSPAFLMLKGQMPEKYDNEDMLGVRETQDDYFKVTFGLHDQNAIRAFRSRLTDWGIKINKLGNYIYLAGWELER